MELSSNSLKPLSKYLLSSSVLTLHLALRPLPRPLPRGAVAQWGGHSKQVKT